MKLLDILERSVERVIHGPIDSLFRQDIQPAEIERHLERAMLDNSRRASGSSIMPNHYSVKLSEADFASIEPYLGSLVRRLESWLADRAEAHEGTLLDRIQIEIQRSGEARRRHPVIEARITDINAPVQSRRRPNAPPPDDRTETFKVMRPSSSASLRILTGQQAGTTIRIDHGRSILGRSHDADIRIDSPEVSRRHLQIDRDAQTIRITDLGSTNGTRVNGEPVRAAIVRNGDEILAGTQALRLVIDS